MREHNENKLFLLVLCYPSNFPFLLSIAAAIHISITANYNFCFSLLQFTILNSQIIFHLNIFLFGEWWNRTNELTVAPNATSNGCIDWFSRLFPCVLTKTLRIPLADLILPLSDSTHMICCRGSVDSGNLICLLHLQVLPYSAVVLVMEGFLEFFHCSSKVTSIVRPHLLNVASSPYKPL